MATQKLKTTENSNSVKSFVSKITEPQRQKDCLTIIEIMKEVSGFEPKMLGPSIIGFGSYHYIYESGREGDAPLVGFSPRKTEFALYICNFEGKDELLKKFGKHKTAKSCLYIKKVGDVDVAVFKKLITGAVRHYKAKYKHRVK